MVSAIGDHTKQKGNSITTDYDQDLQNDNSEWTTCPTLKQCATHTHAHTTFYGTSKVYLKKGLLSVYGGSIPISLLTLSPNFLCEYRSKKFQKSHKYCHVKDYLPP